MHTTYLIILLQYSLEGLKDYSPGHERGFENIWSKDSLGLCECYYVWC